MKAAGAVRPFDLFTREALGAGWYLSWRMFVFSVLALVAVTVLVAMPLAVVMVLILGMAMVVSPGPLMIVVVPAWGAYVYILIWLTNRFARGWSRKTWGRDFEQGVWWGITWRTMLANLPLSLGGGVVIAVLGDLGQILGALINLASIPVTLMVSGWAMSIMVAQRLGVATMAAVAGTPAPAASTPISVAPGERVQCPKCGLRETERGSVIGWYCRVCGWRQSAA
jgi:hypothetical protein